MSFLRFAALFIPVYVAWQGYMAHATLHKAAPADPDERDAPPRTVGAVHPDRARRVGRGSGGRDLRPALARGLCLGRGPRLRGRRVRLVAVLRPSGERLAARLDHVDRGVLLRAHPAAAGTGRDERGVRMLIDRASQTHFGAGPSVALLGGAALFLASLMGTRIVTTHEQHRRGVVLKLAAVALILALLAAQPVAAPLALAGGLAVVLAGVVVAESTVIAPPSS